MDHGGISFTITNCASREDKILNNDDDLIISMVGDDRSRIPILSKSRVLLSMSFLEDSDGINGSGNCAPCFALEAGALGSHILEINTMPTETNFSLTVHDRA